MVFRFHGLRKNRIAIGVWGRERDRLQAGIAGVGKSMVRDHYISLQNVHLVHLC